jgi:hypothetical protein
MVPSSSRRLGDSEILNARYFRPIIVGLNKAPLRRPGLADCPLPERSTREHYVDIVGVAGSIPARAHHRSPQTLANVPGFFVGLAASKQSVASTVLLGNRFSVHDPEPHGKRLLAYPDHLPRLRKVADYVLPVSRRIASMMTLVERLTSCQTKLRSIPSCAPNNGKINSTPIRIIMP